MSILDEDKRMDKTDFNIERSEILGKINEFFVMLMKKASLPVLFIDPDNEVNLETLVDEIGEGATYVNMALYRAIPFASFEQDIIIPFVNGEIKSLLLDNVDCFPDDPQFFQYRGILRSMMKEDLWLIYHNKLSHGGQGPIGMRCVQVPDFKPVDCPSIIDCKSDIWIEALKQQ